MEIPYFTLTEPLDEFTLAAFIAGTLPRDERRHVTAYLSKHAEARELLHMALEALDAADDVDVGLPASSGYVQWAPIAEALADGLEAEASDFKLQWEPVPLAVRYRLVILDTESGALVAWRDTDQRRLDPLDVFAATAPVRRPLKTGQAYALHIYAFDATDTLVGEAGTIGFCIQA